MNIKDIKKLLKTKKFWAWTVLVLIIVFMIISNINLKNNNAQSISDYQNDTYNDTLDNEIVINDAESRSYSVAIISLMFSIVTFFAYWRYGK